MLQPAGLGLTQQRSHQPSDVEGRDTGRRHRRAAHGLFQAAPMQGKRSELPDRLGNQYASYAVQDVLKEYDITSSMSREGDFPDTPAAKLCWAR